MTTSNDSSRPENLLEIGRIGKAHGIKGEVVVNLISSRTERLDPGSVLFTPSGTIEVKTSRPHQGRFLVGFTGISTRNEAETLRGTLLLAEPIEDPDGLWVNDLIGKNVVDQHGVERGKVVALVANPASDLLELDSGALVPLRFVTKSAEQILVDVPDGLFELAEPE